MIPAAIIGYCKSPDGLAGAEPKTTTVKKVLLDDMFSLVNWKLVVNVKGVVDGGAELPADHGADKADIETADHLLKWCSN
jgi:hypothetical protein